MQKTAFDCKIQLLHKTAVLKKEILYIMSYVSHTKNQLKTVQKIEHNLAYMDYAMIFCLQFYWLLVS